MWTLWSITWKNHPPACECLYLVYSTWVRTSLLQRMMTEWTQLGVVMLAQTQSLLRNIFIWSTTTKPYNQAKSRTNAIWMPYLFMAINSATLGAYDLCELWLIGLCSLSYSFTCAAAAIYFFQFCFGRRCPKMIMIIYVLVCICMLINIYILNACKSTNIYIAYLCTCICMLIDVSIYVDWHMCMYVCVSICMYSFFFYSYYSRLFICI